MKNNDLLHKSFYFCQSKVAKPGELVRVDRFCSVYSSGDCPPPSSIRITQEGFPLSHTLHKTISVFVSKLTTMIFIYIEHFKKST